MDILITTVIMIAVGVFTLRQTRSVTVDLAIKNNIAKRQAMREALEKQKKVTKTKEQEYEDAKRNLLDSMSKSDS